MQTTAHRDDEGGLATNAVRDPSPHDGADNRSKEVGRRHQGVVGADHRFINLFHDIPTERRHGPHRFGE